MFAVALKDKKLTIDLTFGDFVQHGQKELAAAEEKAKKSCTSQTMHSVYTWSRILTAFLPAYASVRFKCRPTCVIGTTFKEVEEPYCFAFLKEGAADEKFEKVVFLEPSDFKQLCYWFLPPLNATLRIPTEHSITTPLKRHLCELVELRNKNKAANKTDEKLNYSIDLIANVVRLIVNAVTVSSEKRRAYRDWFKANANEIEDFFDQTKNKLIFIRDNSKVLEWSTNSEPDLLQIVDVFEKFGCEIEN